MPSFEKGEGLHNSNEMRLSGMAGMGLLISPSLRNYTTNIGIRRGSTPMYASMFWFNLAGDPPFFSVGETLDFMMLT